MPLQLDIVTPEGTTFSGQVDTVVIPGVQGEAGLLPSHAALVSTIKPGELSYIESGKEHFLAIGDGFAEIHDDKVSIVTDIALGDADIDENAVEEAMKRAEEAIKEKDVFGEDYALLQATIAKSTAQLNMKRRRRKL